MTIKRVLLSWSSGKDSARTLHMLRQDPNIEVAGLLTSFNADAELIDERVTRDGFVFADVLPEDNLENNPENSQ